MSKRFISIVEKSRLSKCLIKRRQVEEDVVELHLGAEEEDVHSSTKQLLNATSVISLVTSSMSALHGEKKSIMQRWMSRKSYS